MAVDDELVRRAQAGERKALVKLVEREQARVFGVGVAVTSDASDAADATQETFVRMLRSLHTFRAGDDAALSTWLHRIAINACVDSLRQRQRAPRRLYVHESPEHGVHAVDIADRDASAQPERRAMREELVSEVEAALATLPAAQRAALRLRYLEDTSCEHVALSLGLPLNTVKSHIHRGKARLRRLLAPERAVAC